MTDDRRPASGEPPWCRGNCLTQHSHRYGPPVSGEPPEDALTELTRICREYGLNISVSREGIPTPQTPFDPIEADIDEAKAWAARIIRPPVSGEPSTEALAFADQGHCASDCCDWYPRLHVHGDRDEYHRWLEARATPPSLDQIVRAALRVVDQDTPLAVGEPLIQKAIRYATNLTALTSKEERP